MRLRCCWMHAALAGQVAGVVQGQPVRLHPLGLDAAGGAQLVQDLDDVEDVEGIGAGRSGSAPPSGWRYRRGRTPG